MLSDYLNSETAADFECDVCIVGTGPAGMSLALEFRGTGHRVCLIEGGGVEPDGDAQAVYAGETVGVPHTDLDACRLRYLGGSSNCWNGWCAAFDPIDFEARPWVPYSDWPINWDDIEPYYPRAGVACEIGADGHDEAIWDKLDLDRPAFDRAKVRLCHWRISPPTRFGDRYLADIEQAPNIHLVVNASAVELEASGETGAVTALALAGLNGRRGRVRARHYVLACGGIENPRLMLASTGTHAAGLGNAHDQVGRYFMEHPYATSALLYTRDAIYRPDIGKAFGGIPVDFGFSIAPELQRARECLGSMLLLERQDGVDTLFSWGNRALPDAPEGFHRYVLLSQSEQAPDPASRITLSDMMDPFGRPRARMDWRLGAQDKRNIVIQAETLGGELARLGLGRLKLADWLLDGDAFWGVRAGNHHMGTTRMGTDPRGSVVDAHCQVHGVPNLHIAGSSVFTTSSWANPTLTLVALAIRLADRLKDHRLN